MSEEDNQNTHDGAASSYPAAFYCPITKKLMKDPVVLEDGRSYERSAIVTDASTKLYENRALKTIIEESTRSALQKIQDKARQLITAENRPLSGGFYCPITLSLMHIPVIDPQGYTYEKAAIESWILANGDSPVTRQTLAIADLRPNTAISDLLHARSTKKDEIIHPALQKWMTESPPSMSSIELAPTTSGGEDTVLDASNVFPTTPEEYAAQLTQNAREQRRRMVCRFLSLLIMLLLIVGSFFVPYLAAVLLGVVLVTVCIVTQDAAQ